jgi:hypothetical protein
LTAPTPISRYTGDGKVIMSKEGGRRVKAAVISYLMGYKGVDYVLKDMPEDPGEYWSDLGEKLARGMNTEVVEQLSRSKKRSLEIVPKKDSDEIIQ